MHPRHPKAVGVWHRRFLRILLGSAAVVVLVAPGRAGGAGTGGTPDDDARMIADARQTEHAIFVAYNDRKWDELRTQYTEDAVGLPPNHDPVLGRDAWADYLRSIRDVAGPLDPQFDWVRVRVTGGRTAHVVSKFTTQSGRVHMTYTGLYERQPDGSALLGVDQFGFGDAVR